MMGRALLVVGALATLGFLATGLIGYLVEPEAESHLPLHIMVGLVSALLLLFSHCWIMFYLIGTGKAVKETVAEHGLEGELVERTRRFKGRSYPALMLAMLLVMATFILGGGVPTGDLPAWLHHLLFLAALAAQLRALYLESLVLTENEELMSGINRRLTQGGEV